MFGKTKDTTEKPPVATGPKGDPWDDKTLAWLKSTSMLGLYITNIERRYKSGPAAPGRASEYNPEIVVSGYLPHAPQHVHLLIEFKPDHRGFGSGWLTYQMDEDHPSGKLNVPYLAIQLADTDGLLRAGIVEAMRDAITAGSSVAEARVWPKFAENWDAIEGGHSRSFDIDGMIVWAYARSPRLLPWALPIGEWDLAAHPQPSSLRRRP